LGEFIFDLFLSNDKLKETYFINARRQERCVAEWNGTAPASFQIRQLMWESC